MSPPLPLPPSRLVLLAAIALTVTACGPAKVKGPDPNPVGQWRWKDDTLRTSALMVVTAEGKFVRETTSPIEPKVSKVSGSWSVKVTETEPTWMQRYGFFQKRDPLDELERTRTGKYPSSTTQWSARGILTLRYSVPKGTELVPGATVLAATINPLHTLDGKPPETPVEENQSLRIRTETGDGGVFMELGGKTFEKFEGPVNFTPPSPPKDGASVPDPKMKPGSQAAAATVQEKPAYVTVEPFAGVSLELPRDWQGLDPEATDPATPSTPVETLVGKRGFAGPKSSWGFVPPGHSGAEINIALNRQSATAAGQKLDAWPQEAVNHLTKSLGETLAPILEGRGFRLKNRPTWERMKHGSHSALLWQDDAESSTDGTMAAQILFVPLERASVVATFLWTKTPSNPWEPAIDKARTTLRIADSAGSVK